jgi:hypothetical protein
MPGIITDSLRGDILCPVSETAYHRILPVSGAFMHAEAANYGYATDNAGWAKSDRPILLWSPDSKKDRDVPADTARRGADNNRCRADF